MNECRDQAGLVCVGCVCVWGGYRPNQVGHSALGGSVWRASGLWMVLLFVDGVAGVFVVDLCVHVVVWCLSWCLCV
jgi:hypothetical protein